MPDLGERVSEGSIRQRAAATAGRASIATARVEGLLLALEHTTDPEERATILVEVAIALRDELGDRVQAIDALMEAFRSDPSLEAVLDHLEPLVREEGRWAEVLETTRVLATQERDPKRSIVYAETMVRWLTREVAQPDLARQWLDRLRSLDSTHALVHLLQAAVSREHGDKKRELDELDLAVLSTRRKDDRARIHLLMASRFLEDERTKNLVEAKKHFAAAHKLFPRSMDPLVGLEQAAVTEGDKRALAEVLKKQTEADVPVADRASILLRIAELEEKEFRRPENAAQTLERVVALASEHPELGAALEVALDGLERCYGAARAWSSLVVVLERAVTITNDAALRTTRLKRLADVLEAKLGDVRAAVAVWKRLLVAMPNDEMVLGELARLAEKLGDVEGAVEHRQRLAELATDPTTRARMHVIAGQLLVPTDDPAARRHFEAAVEADPSNQAAWNALLWGARAAGDAQLAEKYLEDRAMRATTARARAVGFVELAEARARAGNAALARAAWEEAAASDPTNEVAAAALATALVGEGRYAEAEPLCEVAIAAAERDRDFERLFTLRLAQTTAFIALGESDRALAAALAAYKVRAGSVHAKEVLVAAAVTMRADPRVLEVRDALVTIAEDPETMSVQGRASLADIFAVTGDRDRAAALYADVLAEDPEHQGALAGLSQHHAAAGKRVESLRLKWQIARRIASSEERFGALVEIAEDFATRAKSDELAAEVYEEARAIRPNDLPILYRLLALHQNLGQWAHVFDVLRSISEIEGDPVRRAKTLYTMAQIARDELADRGAALGLFEQALDVDPSHLVAFERIVRMLTEDRDWPGLERMYARMIERALKGDDTTLQHALYKQVGLVYRDRLKRPDLAITAYQVAVHLRPDDEEGQTILRELLSRSGYSSGAVALTIERVLREPLDSAPYPALFELLLEQGERDRAYVVASAMRFLGVSHAAASGFRAQYPHPPIEGIVLDLGTDGYREILHPNLDPALTEIFQVVAPALIDIALGRLSLRERIGHPGPALKSPAWLPPMVARAAAILGAPPARLYERRTPGRPFSPAATRPPSLLVYPPSLGGVAPGVQSFLVGKRVCELCPELLARALCPSTSELKALAESAVRIATDLTEPGDVPLKERLRKEDVARIAGAISAKTAKSGKLDVLRWAQLADVSASRAGLLLAGDLEIARAALAIEAQWPGDLTPREKMKELVGFFLGDGCAALRRRLGVSLS